MWKYKVRSENLTWLRIPLIFMVLRQRCFLTKLVQLLKCERFQKSNWRDFWDLATGKHMKNILLYNVSKWKNMLKKNKFAVSIFLFLLLKCSCLILSTWSLLLMTWHSLVFLWNSSFQYLWHSSALICFWLDIWRALHSQKTNAIDGWASVPSWIFSFTSIRVQFSVSLQVTFISSHLSALMIIKFFMKTNLQLNLSQIAFYKLLLIFTQKLINSAYFSF